mmetsp:Transcript_16177/g.56504  ORF Transcript_16177/g.56504 Transcript_16177/m.56504 type:complete len:213 (-) Transcript_16177:721-1359(-)
MPKNYNFRIPDLRCVHHWKKDISCVGASTPYFSQSSRSGAPSPNSFAWTPPRTKRVGTPVRWAPPMSWCSESPTWHTLSAPKARKAVRASSKMMGPGLPKHGGSRPPGSRAYSSANCPGQFTTLPPDRTTTWSGLPTIRGTPRLAAAVSNGRNGPQSEASLSKFVVCSDAVPLKQTSTPLASTKSASSNDAASSKPIPCKSSGDQTARRTLS